MLLNNSIRTFYTYSMEIERDAVIWNPNVAKRCLGLEISKVSHLLSSAKLHSLNDVQQIARGEYRRLYGGVSIILFAKIILALEVVH